MRKLISEILNSENVIEKCCELKKLNRNWGMGDYNHCFISQIAH